MSFMALTGTVSTTWALAGTVPHPLLLRGSDNQEELEEQDQEDTTRTCTTQRNDICQDCETHCGGRRCVFKALSLLFWQSNPTSRTIAPTTSKQCPTLPCCNATMLQFFAVLTAASSDRVCNGCRDFATMVDDKVRHMCIYIFFNLNSYLCM